MWLIPRNAFYYLKQKVWNWHLLSNCITHHCVSPGLSLWQKCLYPFTWSILYNHAVLSRRCWFSELIRWWNWIHPILSLGLLPFAVKPVIAHFLSVCVLILSTGLLLPWPDLLRCILRVLMRLSRKAGGVTGGLDDYYPSTLFHLTTVQASTTDLISDVQSCSRKVDQ